MSADPRVVKVFGWRNDLPNVADGSSAPSVQIADFAFRRMGVTRTSTEAGQTLGTLFERAVRSILKTELPRLAPQVAWQVGSESIAAFSQYAHLDRLTTVLEEADPEGTIRSEIGLDYIIRPDVTVGTPRIDSDVFLHAAVSCKWTIRSDRVQNIRHEGVVLTRHRRGRQPHVVTVTAEPLPSRLAAIARGTGEVDAVYHAFLDELYEAVHEVGSDADRSVLSELIDQARLLPLNALPEILAYF